MISARRESGVARHSANAAFAPRPRGPRLQRSAKPTSATAPRPWPGCRLCPRGRKWRHWFAVDPMADRLDADRFFGSNCAMIHSFVFVQNPIRWSFAPVCRSAATASTRCSSRVSSILLWLMPLQRLHEHHHRGNARCGRPRPRRATGRTACGASLPASLADGRFAQFDQIGMERLRLDVPDSRPLHRATFFAANCSLFSRASRYIAASTAASRSRWSSVASHRPTTAVTMPGKVLTLPMVHTASGCRRRSGGFQAPAWPRRQARRAAPSWAWSRSAPPGRGR